MEKHCKQMYESPCKTLADFIAKRARLKAAHKVRMEKRAARRLEDRQLALIRWAEHDEKLAEEKKDE